jgi:hypothetical protein
LPPSHIEEIVETHILEIKEVSDVVEEEEKVTIPYDIFKVFATKKKKCNSRLSKFLEWSKLGV